MSYDEVSYINIVSKQLLEKIDSFIQEKFSSWINSWVQGLSVSVQYQEKCNHLFDKGLAINSKESCAFKSGFYAIYRDEFTPSTELSKRLLGCDINEFNQFEQEKLILLEHKIWASLFEFIMPEGETLSLSTELKLPVIKYKIVILDTTYFFYGAASFVNRLRIQSLNKSTLPKVQLLTSSINESEVTLDIKIPSLKVRLNQLSALTVGDVIPLNQLLNKPLPVNLMGNSNNLKGYLVSNQNQKAIILE